MVSTIGPTVAASLRAGMHTARSPAFGLGQRPRVDVAAAVVTGRPSSPDVPAIGMVPSSLTGKRGPWHEPGRGGPPGRAADIDGAGPDSTTMEGIIQSG